MSKYRWPKRWLLGRLLPETERGSLIVPTLSEILKTGLERKVWIFWFSYLRDPEMMYEEQ